MTPTVPDSPPPEPAMAPQRVPTEPLRRIDWMAVAPWLILLRAPAATGGWPLVIGATGAVLLGGFGVNEPAKFGYGWPDLQEPIWPMPMTGLDVVGVGRWIGWVVLGLVIAKLAAPRLINVGKQSLCGGLVAGVSGLLATLAGTLGLLAPPALALAALTAATGWSLANLPPIVMGIAVLLAAPLLAITALLSLAWPLAVGAVVIDRSDSFEVASRVFAYATQRLGRAAFYVAVAVAVGYAVSLPLELLLSATRDWLVYAAGDSLDEFDRARAPFRVAVCVLRGFYPAYFFTAATAIYLLLRRDIDGQPLDEMALPADQPSDAA